LYLLYFSVCRISLNTFWSIGLVVMNSFSFNLSWKVFISHSSIVGAFARHINLSWQLFTFRSRNRSFHAFLAFRVSVENLCFSDKFVFIHDLSLLFCSFK
jgi:hypothetical protein